MDGFNVSKAPLEFQELGNLSMSLHMYTNVAWTIVYVGMIQLSIQDHTYAMPLFSQCLNIAWEITFGFICPTDHWGVTLFFQLAVIINSAVTYTAIKYGAREWDHAPIIKRRLPMIYAVGIGTSIACYVGIVNQIEEAKACFMIAIVLQAILSVGSLSQLLTRGSTRGYSFSLWFVHPSFFGFLNIKSERGWWLKLAGFFVSPALLRWCLSFISECSIGMRNLDSWQLHSCYGVVIYFLDLICFTGYASGT